MRTPTFPLILRTVDGSCLINVRSIQHIVAEDKYARLIHTDGTEQVVFHSLQDLVERLACGERFGDLMFMRTHRSSIVAMHHATADQGKQSLELASGALLPIGRRSFVTLLDVLGRIRRSIAPAGSAS